MSVTRADLGRPQSSFYLMLIPILLVGGLLDAIGSRVFAASGIYSAFPKLFAASNLRMLVLAGNLLMLQDMAVPGFGSNAVLFLLAYEWWAYLVFAAFVLLGRAGRVRGIAVAGVLAGGVTFFAPKFFGYLATWLVGLAIAGWGPRLRGKVAPSLGGACFIAAVAGSRICGARLGTIPPDLMFAAKLLLDWLVALGVGMLLLSMFGRRTRKRRHAFAGRLQHALVRLSLSVYAGHFPLMMFVVAGANVLLALPLYAQPSAAGFLGFALVVAAAYLFAMLMAKLSAVLRSALRKAMQARSGRYIAP